MPSQFSQGWLGQTCETTALHSTTMEKCTRNTE